MYRYEFIKFQTIFYELIVATIVVGLRLSWSSREEKHDSCLSGKHAGSV